MRTATALAWAPSMALTAAEAAPLPHARAFGAIPMSRAGRRSAFNADRMRRLTALRRAAERFPIPWPVWEYSNPYGMSVILPEGATMPATNLHGALALMRS